MPRKPPPSKLSDFPADSLARVLGGTLIAIDVAIRDAESAIRDIKQYRNKAAVVLEELAGRQTSTASRTGVQSARKAHK